ncbi:hypothetical protein GS934_11175 [Rhodococcus hoagii]|nr:hypothetical protein [Prescottella equi]NKZ87738.1 hypothetical protein [Prescottella equi]
MDQGRRQARTPHDVIAGSAAILAWCIVFFPLLNTEKLGDRRHRVPRHGPDRPGHALLQAASSPTPSPRRCATRGRRLILQSGAILGGGLAPMIATALLDATGSSSASRPGYLATVCAISLVGAIACPGRAGLVARPAARRSAAVPA